MDHKTECQLIDELLTLKAAASPFLDETVTHRPVEHYLSEAYFAGEAKAIFHALPIVAAHISEMSEPNSFLRREIAGRSVLLTRDKAGKAHAFLNICRHRGTQLVSEEAGCKSRFSCPYHAWTYDNNGALISAPHFDTGFPDSDKSKLGLTRLPCAEAFGFIWIIADPHHSIDEINTYFDGLAGDLTALNMDDMVIAQDDKAIRKANWKIFIEGGIESYHFKIAHRHTIGPHFEDNLSSYQCFGSHLRSILPRTSMARLTAETRDRWRLRDHANIIYTLFPTTQLLVQQDHIVWITQDPLSPNESEMRLATLVPKARADEQEHWARNHAITTTTLNEDFDIGESIQAGLASGANQHMTFGRFEGALAEFHRIADTYLKST